MRRLLLTTAAMLVLAAPLHAQGTTTHMRRGSAATSSLHWSAAPAVFPKGARMAVVNGDPTKSGPYTVELSMPAGYTIAPHYHPTAEHVAVQRGTFLVGMGDTLNRSKTRALTAGQSGDVAAGMHHYAIAKTRTIIAVSGQGPFALTYVNPADDPQHGHK
jgi:quercetin dioxygenase-like cupin family protein